MRPAKITAGLNFQAIRRRTRHCLRYQGQKYLSLPQAIIIRGLIILVISSSLGTLIAIPLWVYPPACAATPSKGTYTWPTGHRPAILQGYAPPDKPWLPGHRGVDLQLPVGAQVRAAGAGTVLYAGLVANKPVVSIIHADGIRTTYEPVAASVKQGEFIKKGQPIGTLQSADTPGLHWGAKRGSRGYINPISLIIGPIRLKPW